MEIDNTASAAPDQTTSTENVDAPAPAPQPTDIDGISEFKFQGQSYTPEGLAKLLNEHRTNSQKLEESAKYRDYAENLEVDLEKVVNDPRLAAEFKKIYPKQYHAVVDRFIGQRPPASQETAQSTLPKEVQDRIDRLEQKLGEYDQQTHRAQVATSEAYLQKTVDPLFTKYPYADTEAARNAVFIKADQMIQQGYKMNEAAWDRLVKDTHLAIKKQADTLRQRELKEQLEKGKGAQDTGAGGSAPGQAPAKARTFAEATQEALRQIKAF